jgi:hypothetical protein
MPDRQEPVVFFTTRPLAIRIIAGGAYDSSGAGKTHGPLGDSNTQVRCRPASRPNPQLTNVKKIISLAGYTVEDGTPLYWTQPGRSEFVSLAIKL